MGIQDFTAVFDSLDLACTGYITCETLHEFDEVLHYRPISIQHVYAAVSQICRGEGVISRNNFLDVLQELDRRRTIEERAFWDFKALDSNSDGRLSLKDAFLLFRDTHGEKFSKGMWETFLNERESQSDEICFDELRMWLCYLPVEEEPPVDTDFIHSKEEELENNRLTHAVQEYDNAKHWQESAASEERERKQYQDSLLTQAERKQKKWDQEGIEALLFDDGLEAGGVSSAKSRQRIGIKDLYDLLEEKYTHLRQKLIWEMVAIVSDGAFSDGINDSSAENYRELESQVKLLWKSRSLAEKSAELPGSSGFFSSSLKKLIAELPDADAKHRGEVAGRYDGLLLQGKSTAQAWKSLELQYQEFCKGNQTYGGVLTDLLLRYQDEKETLASSIKSWASQSDATSRVTQHYFCLLLQDIVICAGNSFEPSAIACGLSERPQTYKQKRYDWDRNRMERLSAFNLTTSKGRQPRKASSTLPREGSGMKKSELELQGEILRQALETLTAEKEVLIYMLQGRDSVSSKVNAKKLSLEERRGRTNALRSQRQNLRDGIESEAHESQKLQHKKLLQEAVGIAYENRFQELMETEPNVSEDAVNASLLADLQQKQFIDIGCLIKDFLSKDTKELKKLLRSYVRAFTCEHLDTIGFVILGTLDVSEEERRFLDTLDRKYDVIREKILLHALQKQHGSNWTRMSTEERHKELRARKKEEKRLRGEGRRNEMSTLLGPAVQEMLPLRIVMGEDKAEHNQRLGEDEVPAEKIPSTNPLADLVLRQEAEQSYLLDWLRSPEVKVMTFDKRRLGLVKLLLEKLCVEQETDYDCMSFRLGLVERIDSVLTERHTADKLRQAKMSAVCCKLRRHRINQNRAYKKQAVPEDKPDSGDSLGWQMLYLNQVLQRHLEEVEALLQLCQDETLAELQEAAQIMTMEERQKRLCELRSKRRQLDLENEDDREESLTVLEEATAIKTLSRRTHLEAMSGGKGVTVDDVTSSLLEEVYQLQDRELALILQSITDKDEQALVKLFANEVNARRWEMVENVVTVITKYEGEARDEELFQALDEKYDALRDKLLAEALMRQMGEAEWMRLSEQERQRRLALLKLQEKKLRKEGKMDELSKLLGDHELAEKNLRGLLGENRAEAERRLRERLAERQRRKALGEDVNDNEDSDDDISKQDDSGNVLTDLSKRYEEERDALLASLKGRESKFWGEKERQAELLRLKRERRQAEREGRFDEAALVLGLAERQQQQLADRLKNDRKRQEMLAKSRLEELRKRKGKHKDVGKEEIVRKGNRTELQEAVLSLLEGRHAQEQERLFEMLSDKKGEGLRTEAKVMSGVQKEDRLADLKGKLRQVPSGKLKEREELLQQGVTVKVESRRVALSQSTDQPDVPDDLVSVSLMADLQDEQALEAERMITSLQDMTDEEMVTLQEQILSSKKNGMLESVVAIVFAPERQSKTGEGELLTALEEKYDALRDKLLIEALMKQAGDANWQRLSEAERQRRLVELKLKERKLRQENKMDELGKILGDDVKNREALEKLFGETKEDQRRKLQEKLEKRRQRQAQGMSAEECDALEEAEAEEEARKPRNVLLDLQNRFDQEKSELLRRLRESDSKMAEERTRQLELVRLKREQRKVLYEEKFESAALVLGLAREAEERIEQNMQAERERQQRLAKERLEARRNKKYGSQGQTAELNALGDSNDPVFLHESISKEIEARHQGERDYLIQLLQDCDVKSVESLSEAEVAHQLSQFQLTYTSWQNGDSHGREKDTLHNILKSAANIQLRKRQIDTQNSSSQDDLQVALLADLQQLQDDELRMLVASMADKDLESLKKMRSVQSLKRSDYCHDNLAKVLLDIQLGDSEDDSSDDALIRALDMKYDAFKDKVFAEAAKQKMGESWWEAASEEERMREISDLKLHDKQLRDDGKGEEADTILENLLNSAGLQNKLGGMEAEMTDEEKKAQQEKLRAERLEAGMSLDEVMQLEESQEEVDGNAKRKNILEMLKHCYEDEKAALLASLQGQEDRLAIERQRQLEMAKLRRDKRRLQHEDKIDSAAILLDIAHKQETKLRTSLDEERERQRALAQDRLAARRQKKQSVAENDVTSVETRLKEQQNDNLLTDSNDKEGILLAVETKQAEERELLMQLIEAVQEDASLMTKVHSQTIKDIQKELMTEKEKRDKWLMEVQQAKPENDSLEDAKYIYQAATGRAEQFQRLKTCVALKCEASVRKRLETEPGRKVDDLWGEVSLDLLADTQVKQASETEGVQTALLSVQDEALLKRVIVAQRRACAEGWYTTLAEVIFGDAGPADGGEDAEYEESVKSARSRAQSEGLSAEETEALLKDLQLQHEAQIKRKQSMREDQQKQLQEKLALRRWQKSFKEDAEDEALNLLLISGAQAEAVQDHSRSEKLRQNSLMQERLAQRRAARKSQSEPTSGVDQSRPSTQDSKQSITHRQRSKLNVEVTDDQKHATYSQLVRQQSNLYRKISEQQSRQEEMLQRRLEQISSRREEEAAALFSLGERQKTVLEKSKQEERERQVSRVQERVARVRYERTMTMRDRSRSPAARTFEELKEEPESEGLSKDDKMNLMAQDMENKFKEQKDSEHGEKSKESLMTDQSRLDKLKQRRAEKKGKRLTFAPMPE